MIIVRGTAHFAPGEIERLRPQLNAYVDYVRAQEGCIDYCYGVDLADPDCLHIIQLWRDEASQSAYMQDLSELMAILAGARMKDLSTKAYEAEFLKVVMGEGAAA